ncbi:FtsK/SpoIIIE domain-containing protein [Sporolactobacillus terrae]|uniref:Cell division protein FtsK n=1 Tax=Sporolactobacillus terrae TaxID=269673 RepID=A0ABX5QAA9_9BACL|nr:FtsK/SpoIIIE domain-containing protein [Sporolactobacillus terrae]QAA23531.1 cell division protein FtsK [Sporolactobacillus terrae]QAA26501.1 cell division protein FtsK [Sporolactobacillus terrae]
MTMNHKGDDVWKIVQFPPKPNRYLLQVVGVLIILVSIIKAWAQIITLVPNTSLLLGWFIDTGFLAISTILIFRLSRWYLSLFRRDKSRIANNLSYMVSALKLYDEELFETVNSQGEPTREKRIVRTIRILYKELDKKVIVRVMRDGDRFNDQATTLGATIEGALGLEIETTNQTVSFVEYTLLKEKDKRINLNSTVSSVTDSDEIKISGNISYELHKVAHSLIVGGTGSGKSFFILGKIISYLSLTPQADLRIIDPKKADLSLLRFVNGFENKVATEASQICRILRETVELMEQRYATYFNDVSAFGKTYRDFNLPVVIVIFDEFAAFMHSVDKKLSKECLDYVFSIIMKGRQAGVMMEVLMQRPSADDLPTNIRSQMGFKAGLGNMDSIGYNMIFDTNNVDYKTVTEKGGGYIQIDGVHTSPVYFETPMIEKGYDFIGEIKRLMGNGEKQTVNHSE